MATVCRRQKTRATRSLTACLQQCGELFHTQTGFVNNLPKGARTKRAMVRNNHTRIRRFAAEDHMTSFLPLEHETVSLKSPSQVGA